MHGGPQHHHYGPGPGSGGGGAPHRARPLQEEEDERQYYASRQHSGRGRGGGGGAGAARGGGGGGGAAQQSRVAELKNASTPQKRSNRIEDSYDGDGEASDHSIQKPNAKRAQHQAKHSAARPAHNFSDVSSSDDDQGTLSDASTGSSTKPPAMPTTHFVDDRETILIMKIMTPNGEKVLEIKKGDDPQRAAEAFVRSHHIPAQKVQKIVNFIMENVVFDTLPGGAGYSAVAARATHHAPAAAPAPAPAPAAGAAATKPKSSSTPGTASDNSSASESAN